MDRWREMELFVQVAERRSVSRAAEALGMSNAAGSRHLSALEQRLGARLVERNTRRLFLTEAGERFLQHSRNLMTELQEAEAEVNASTPDPSGTLRITASVSFSIKHISPLLPQFGVRYPKVTVNLMASNRYYDLVDNNIDLAIRTREFEADSSLTVRRLAETRRVLAASPAYLSAFGTPHKPEDLTRHRLLIYSYANNPDELRLKKGSTTRVIKVAGWLESNEGQVIREAGLRGLGILVQPTYVIYDDLVAGRLVPVIDDWDLPRLRINLAYPSRRHQSAKVRGFIELMTEHFRTEGFERRWTTRFLAG